MPDTALAESRSPFLRHGAEQPVDWLPWGEDAFERARREDRPVLLDIGAVWCHWCHVMDRESYEDTDTAALINELFVPVKVDRDERPDVDTRYQRAVQSMTGQGGWPLTAFLTPDGDAFYGGTYFPPRDAHGRPGFPRVLREVARIWREERARAEQAASGIAERLGELARAEAEPGEASRALVDDAVEKLAGEFDFRWGGFGQAPKFPAPAAVALLLDRWQDVGEDWVRRIVVDTLDAMARGGIHDQLGGGFHRYATDARWLVPHFEKMAYDNGPLLDVYARAAAALERDDYAAVADGIVGYHDDVAPELLAEGGFPASQDADVGPDDDGGYWTWTEEEARGALDDERLARIATLRYGLRDPASAMHLDPTRHVPYRARDAVEIARLVDEPAEQVAPELEPIRARLKRARDGRPRPFVDRTVYAGWTGLVCSGHLAAERWLGRREAGDAALRALERLWREGRDDDGAVRHRLGDPESLPYLDDQALVAQALLDAFEARQEPAWLERAASLAALVLDRFTDPATGALRDRPADAAAAARPLETPRVSVADAPEPAGAAVAALTMLRLHALTRDERWLAGARRILEGFAGSAARFPTAAATYLRAVDWLTAPVTTVVVVEGNDGRPPTADGSEVGGLLRAALRTYRPRTVVRRFAPGAVEPERLPEELGAMLTGDAPRAYVCAGRTCAAPVAQPAALAELLRTFRG